MSYSEQYMPYEDDSAIEIEAEVEIVELKIVPSFSEVLMQAQNDPYLKLFAESITPAVSADIKYGLMAEDPRYATPSLSKDVRANNPNAQTTLDNGLAINPDFIVLAELAEQNPALQTMREWSRQKGPDNDELAACVDLALKATIADILHCDFSQLARWPIVDQAILRHVDKNKYMHADKIAVEREKRKVWSLPTIKPKTQ